MAKLRSNRKKYANGSFLKDYGKGMADSALGMIGLGEVIPDNAYDNKNIGKIANATGTIGKAVLPMALGSLGIPPKATSMAQNVIGGFNPEQQNQFIDPIQMQAMGGNIKYGPGGPIRPSIQTNNPNDPRLQAYNDSLSVYNNSQTWNKLIDQYNPQGGQAKLINGMNYAQAAMNTYNTPEHIAATKAVTRNPGLQTSTDPNAPYINMGNVPNGYNTAQKLTATQPVQPYVYKAPAPKPKPVNTTTTTNTTTTQGTNNTTAQTNIQPVVNNNQPTQQNTTANTQSTTSTTPTYTGPTWTDYYGVVHKGVQPKAAQYQAPTPHAQGGSLMDNNMNQLQNSMLTRYDNGGTHESNPNGGIPIGQDSLVEQGETRMDDYIFSDRLKYKGKSTYADQSKKIENSYKDTKDDLRLEAKKKHLENLQNHQENLRNTMVDKAYKKAYGGNIGKKMLDGTGPLANFISNPNDSFNDWANQLPNSGQTPYNPANGLQYETPVDPGLAGLNPNPNIRQSGVASGAGNMASTSQNGAGNMIGNNINPFIAGAQMLGPLSELMYGLKGGDKVNYERAKVNILDPTSAQRVANNGITEAYNAANSGLRNNNLTSGQYMSNRLQSAGQEAGQKSSSMVNIQNQYDTMNSNMLNQNSMFNSQVQMKEADARQQEKDAARTYVTNGLNDLGHGANGYNRDLQMNDMQNMILQNMGTDKWVLDASGKPVLRRGFGGKIKSSKNNKK